MRELKPHPAFPCDAVRAIEAFAARPRPGRLELSYVLDGEMARLAVPALTAATRAEELWRHTCFEAFVRAPGHDGYLELNLSPSRQWAAYAFDGYRSGMRPEGGVGVPEVEVRASDTRLELRAGLDVDAAAVLPSDAPWRLGLSAVVEQTAGGVCYWALRHPPGRPDFHHADCFALELPAGQGA
jgi:hypothetical protein